MDLTLIGLEALSAGLAAGLALIAAMAAKSFGEFRFAIVAIGMVILGAVSLLGLLDEVGIVTPGSQVGLLTAILILFVEGMLYLFVVVRGSGLSPTPHGQST